MDDFTTKDKKGLREKNLYILHLDAPRIIIISSVMLGLIVISVLIGMNINKHDEMDNDIFANDNTIFDNLLSDTSEKSNPMGTNIAESPFDGTESLPNSGNSFNTADNIINKEITTPADNMLGSNRDVPVDRGSKISNKTSDILTHENIELIIPPSNLLKKSETTTSSESKKTQDKNIKKKREIVEVSSKDRSYTAPKTENSYFAVQVASYDKKAKALSEAKRLEGKKYDAYVDSAYVKGKKYYRVRIGPIYSKRKACDLLDEITMNDRYEESYIIKK